MLSSLSVSREIYGESKMCVQIERDELVEREEDMMVAGHCNIVVYKQ
jgi:hypothetical protein